MLLRVVNFQTVQQRYFGIDFSGDALQWGANVGIHGGRRAVWIADVTCTADGARALERIYSVQQLLGSDRPFDRLVRLLTTENFTAAGIDAPFSIPAGYLPENGWKGLLQKIHSIDCGDRPFPTGDSLLAVTRYPIEEKKPLRKTEKNWRHCRPRSTLWTGGRPGAPFTVACLKLLARTQCPVWPWDKMGPRLLAEAFPAAQLTHWAIPFRDYQKTAGPRRVVIDCLAQKIILRPEHRSILEESGDALDAVVCSFAAEAATTGKHLKVETEAAQTEGWISILNE